MRIKCRQPPEKPYAVERTAEDRARIEIAYLAACEPEKELPYTVDFFTLEGVPWHEGLEDDVRAHFGAYVAAGAAVEHEREALRRAVMDLADNYRKGF